MTTVSANPISVTIPSGTVAGDIAYLFAAQGFDPDTTTLVTAGWTVLDHQVGANTNGAVLTKALSSGDITAGSISVGFSGTFDGTVAIATFTAASVVSTRSTTFNRDGSGAFNNTVTTPSGVLTTDYALYFGMNRNNNTPTVNQGSPLQLQNIANASTVLHGDLAPSAGTIAAFFAYPGANVGLYDGIVVIEGGGSGGSGWLPFNDDTVTDFTQLADVPSSYTGQGSKIVRVNSGASALEFDTVSATIDTIGATQGDVLYRSGSAWTALAPGTTGQYLTTNGAGANPSWTNITGTTYTPTDTSGAGLTFSVNNAEYVKIGPAYIFSLFIIFPTTTSTANVSIGGLPSVLGFHSASTYSNSGLIIEVINHTGTLNITNAATGLLLRNIDMSGLQLVISGVFF